MGAAPLGLDVLDGLDSLAAQSLLRQHGTDADAEPRFQMLETIQEYGLEQLHASGEAEALRQAHLAYFLTLAEGAVHHFYGPQERVQLEMLEREHDNFRAALGRAREQGDAAGGLRLAGALAYFWFSRGYLSEGREWLEGLLTLTNDGAGGATGAEVPASVQAHALYGAGDLAMWQGGYRHAVVRLEQCLALARATGDLALAVDALNRLGITAICEDNIELAAQRFEEGLALARELGDPVHIEGPLNNLGEIAYMLGDLARAAAYYEEALAYARQIGDRHMHIMMGNLANVARRQNNLAKAAALYRESLKLAQEPGDPRSIAECLEGMAMIVAASGNGARAARLLGASAAVRDAIGTPQPPNERADLEATLQPVRAALGEKAWEAAVAAGRALSLEQAIQEALDTPSN